MDATGAPNAQVDTTTTVLGQARLAHVGLEQAPPSPLPGAPVVDPTGTNVGGRTHRWDSIAQQVVSTNMTIDQLAGQFGYTYGGMAALLRTPQMVERIGHWRERVLDRASVAAAKVLLRLDEMIDLDLAIAIPTHDDGTLDGTAASSAKSIAVRHYLVDKVLVPKQVVSTTNKTEQSDETVALILEARETLKALRELMPQRIVDIHSSPHVLEGDAAVVKAIDVGQ